MIASWRGLTIAAALAVVLVIAVAIDLGHTRRAPDRALVPGFDPDRVTELVWERAGQPAIHVVRDAGAWEIGAPSPQAPHVSADPSAIGDVLAALRGARWHRRGEPAPVHATLTVVAGAERHVLGIGEPIAGTEQSWLVDDGRGVVVDRWVARALDRDALALRIKTPFAEIGRAQAIIIDGTAGDHVPLRLAGTPRRLESPGGIIPAAELARELERALAGVTIVRLPDGPVTTQGLSIFTSDEVPSLRDRSVVHLTLGGSCPGAPELVAVSGTVGDGCVEPATLAALAPAISRLQQPPAATVERRPVPFEPQRIDLADRVELDTPTLRVGDAAADPARVAELLAALAAPAEVVALPAVPATQHLHVTGAGGATILLDLFAGHILARHGEPLALRPAPGAWSLLVRPSRELRDATLWLEEPTTITAVRIDDVRYQRGAVIGDWIRAGSADPRPADARTLEALVGWLAAPRAFGFLDSPILAVHRVIIEITPPAGAPTEHTLTLGAPRDGGCPARLERGPVLLPALVCAQVAALAR